MEESIKIGNAYLKLTDISGPGILYLKNKQLDHWKMGASQGTQGDPIIKNIKFPNPIVCRSKDRSYNLFKILN